MNSEDFLDFLQQIFSSADLFDQKEQDWRIIFLDNAPIHRSKKVIEYLEANKIIAIFNASYCPEANFAEVYIKIVKSKLMNSF